LRLGGRVELARTLHVVLGIALKPCDDTPLRGPKITTAEPFQSIQCI